MDSEAQAPAVEPTRTVRRSARAPAKAPAKTPANAAGAPPESLAKGKRKAREPAEKSPEEKLEYLLTNSKSKLTDVDISDVINYENFLELSEDVQNRLCALLPSTAFSTYPASVCSTHPDGPASREPGSQGAEDRMEVDSSAQGNILRNPATLDPMVFSSPFFLSAAHTFQDHLYSSWLGKKALDDLQKFQEGARTGNIHADWKDEVWELERQPIMTKAQRKKLISADLTALAKHGLLQEGDVLAYKRSFPALDVVVEKDVLVEKIDMRTYIITLSLSPGTQRELPPFLLVQGAEEQDAKILTMEDVFDPVALERGVLDVDGRVRSADKYAQDLAACGRADASGGPTDEVKNMISVRAWKSFTVWRWQEHMRQQTDRQITQERGGRERVATLFYLRGCCLSGQ
ncbi:hypothetical protein GY45DRAFT_1325670 [Cubamyces sp. BRFM 1775]|nr:hypothetical protein GY45DRAFT_1325670 [Cubamyces sp. BRFM 1775]